MNSDMKRLLISLILLALVFRATVPGYCYTNVIAEKTPNAISGYNSMLQVGLSPVAGMFIAGATIAVPAAIAGTGTYKTISSRLNKAIQESTETLPESTYLVINRNIKGTEPRFHEYEYDYNEAVKISWSDVWVKMDENIEITRSCPDYYKDETLHLIDEAWKEVKKNGYAGVIFPKEGYDNVYWIVLKNKDVETRFIQNMDFNRYFEPQEYRELKWREYYDPSDQKLTTPSPQFYLGLSPMSCVLVVTAIVIAVMAIVVYMIWSAS
jgi:hypothetical protein